MSDELLIVLPSTRYDIISAYTRERIAGSDCPGEKLRGDVWYTVAIAEHEENRKLHCMLPQKSACEYLSGVAKLTGVNWIAQELRPITDFMSEVRCNTGNNASGRR